VAGLLPLLLQILDLCPLSTPCFNLDGSNALPLALSRSVSFGRSGREDGLVLLGSSCWDRKTFVLAKERRSRATKRVYLSVKA
jgi:hypothetical protein